ncbi:acyl carrier protein [Ktedonosporobacter rubrisoli]|uniref:Acyl carrier protein n=1 Tax=Ktedonosporobacter rubrisoli TaxID=2509675 RepID=A0A4P6JPI9_KTERU|nr:acyl carrier protein [Ktedonosporobacter rubrisoli]QBD77195.1 acyl carrier protein [Ktedonosporobacter rubrisoli]
MTQEIEKRVVEIIAHHLKMRKEKITLETHLMGDLGADSIDIVSLGMRLEEEFCVTIPSEVMMSHDRLQDLITYLTTLLEKQTSVPFPPPHKEG